MPLSFPQQSLPALRFRAGTSNTAAPESAYESSGSSPPRFGQAAQMAAAQAGGKAFIDAEASLSKLFTPKKTEPVGFKSLAGPSAINQALLDIAGVWAPKLIVLRSYFQFFEETFLEFVEDLAFYFSTALAGLGLHGPMAKLGGLKSKNAAEEIGKGLGGKVEDPKVASKNLIAAKLGTVLGALGIGSGFEFMIQHAKNVMTATQFHTRNFTAVAGLEGSQNEAAKGEADPVDKAKRRLWQTGLATVGMLAAAFAAPKLVLHNAAVEKGARKFLSYVDFSKGKAFDLSKVFLAVLAGVGAVSYFDASRDSLERKENATRLAVVIPYMLFGKELMNLAVAKFHETFGSIQVDGKEVKLRKLKEQLNFSFIKGNPIKKALNKETFLDMGVVRSKDELMQHMDDLTKNMEKSPQTEKWIKGIKEGLSHRSGAIGNSAFYLSAATTGILINLIAYAMTRERFKRQKAQEQDNQANATVTNRFQPANHFQPFPTMAGHLQSNVFPLPSTTFRQAGAAFTPTPAFQASAANSAGNAFLSIPSA